MQNDIMPEDFIHPKDKGDIAEASVIASLVKQGYKVALPVGENLPFDLIAIRPDFSLVRIQVKYRSLTKEGSVVVKLASTWKNSILTRVIDYDLSIIDCFAVYCPEIDRVAYVSTTELIGLRHFSLRVSLARNSQIKGVRAFEAYSVLK